MSADLPRPRQRLLVLTSTYPRWRGDPEPAFVHELAKRLVEDFEVVVLGPHAPGARTTEELDGVDVRRFRYAPASFETLVNDGGIVNNLRRNPLKWALVPGFLCSQLWSLWRLARQWKPDVIHAHWLVPQGLAAALLRAVVRRSPPFVVTSHGADLFALRTWPLPAMKRFVARRAAATTVVSGAMREALVRLGVDGDLVDVCPMGVDLASRFTPGMPDRRSRDEILFVGRLVEKKGLRYLIDAMPEILRACPSARLTVAGFGPEERACKAQVARLGLDECVRFAGAVRQRDLPDLYRRAAVFVAPFVQASSGDQEGLGLVMVEAAGCACPVIASDLPAVRHVARDVPITLVQPGSPIALAHAVSATLAEPPAVEALSLACETLRAQYDWPAVAATYARVLRRAAESGPTNA